jgi:hypothetical protein
MAVSYHVGNVLVPRFAREGYSYTLGEKAEKLKEGDLTYNNELLSKVTGQRFYSVNAETLKDNLYFRTKEFTDAYEGIKDGFKINKTDSSEDIINKYIKQNEKYYKFQVDFNKAVRASSTLNLDSLVIRDTLNRTLSGFSSVEKESFLLGDNSFKPLRLNNYNFKTLFQLDDKPDVSYLDFTELYSNAYQKLSHLPLIEKNEYSTIEKEAIELIKSPERLNKFEGGEVDVPFTKDEPENRIDSFTGKPYSDQMARLGLAEGGQPQDILSFIGQARGYEDLSFLRQYSDDVKWQEVRGAGPTTVQNNNGPARGSYQVEGSEGSSRNETILQRAKNFYEKYPNAPKSKEIEYALSQQGKDLDFSTLSELTQDSLFFIDAERGTLPLDKLATGELNNKTAWMEHWNQGPDRKVMEDKWDKAQKEKEILLQQQLVQ